MCVLIIFISIILALHNIACNFTYYVDQKHRCLSLSYSDLSLLMKFATFLAEVVRQVSNRFNDIITK